MDLYELTHPQKRIWYTQKLYNSYPLNNIGGCFEIHGKIDINLLKKTINIIIDNNDALRLRFCEIDGQPMQYFVSYQEENVEFFDFSKDINPEKTYNKWVENIFNKTFKFTEEPLYYFAIYKISDDKMGVLAKLHHIISDGWTIYSIIRKQICRIYDCLKNNREIKEDFYSYLDYIDKEKSYKDSDKFKKNKEFWVQNVQNISEDFMQIRSSEIKGNRQIFKLNNVEESKLKEFIDDKWSMFELFTALIGIYFYKTTNKENITIGMPILNRSGAKDKKTIGMFVSTMPFRFRVEANITFNEYLQEIRKEIRKHFRNQKYPYDLMMTDNNIVKRGFDGLFNLSLNYYNTTDNDYIDDFKTEMKEFYSGYQTYSLQLLIKESTDSKIILCFDYKKCDYTKESIIRIKNMLTNILSQLTNNILIKDIQLLKKEEIASILKNQTSSVYPKDKSIIRLFEEQVNKTPQSKAVIHNKDLLTYKGLNSKSNRIANYLKEIGIEKGDIIAVMGKHSPEIIAAILGVLKIGGVYLPIDIEYPRERINYMLNDSNASIMLSNMGEELNFDINTLNINDILERQNQVENFDSTPKPEDLAYIIYTSGTTGRPKGVMINHRSLVNYICASVKNYTQKDKDEVFAFYSSIAFDLTVTSIFTPLISGNAIAVYDDDGSEFVLEKILKDNIVTVIKLTPSHLSIIKDVFVTNTSIKRMIVGGEALKTNLANDIYNKFDGRIDIYNEYGPTEATVGCMIYKYDINHDKEVSVPIGRPIENVKIYILNRDLNLVPSGVIGELYISGDCLSIGYLNKAEITKERFITNPFSDNSLMYKTGDLAKRLEDNNIIYAGRTDNQVKLRGFRIELEEIEQCLMENEKVKQAVAIVKNNSIYAYVVCSDFDEKELKQWVANYVPAYMIPSCVINIDHIPLTVNGKLDKDALPQINKDKVDFVNCSNEIEKALVEVMKEVLRIDAISMEDNYFYLGGDSIKAIQISSRLRDRGYHIKPKDILSNELIKEIALSVSLEDSKPKAEQSLIDGVIKKTPIMKWFFDNKFENVNYYNQSITIELKEVVNYEDVKTVIKTLIKKHDSFRINYDRNKDELFYNNNVLDENNVYYYDLANDSYDVQKEKIKCLSDRLKSSFDIENGLLLKTGVFNLGDRQIILFTAHHLSVDGVSFRIFLEDFFKSLKQLSSGFEIELSPKTHSYKKWANELMVYKNTDFKEQLPYWSMVHNCNFEYPVDFNKGQALINNSIAINKVINKDKTKELLDRMNAIYGMSLNEVLISSIALTLSDMTDENDIILELEGHGREDINPSIDTSRTIGWFTTIFPAYFTINEGSVSDKIKSLKEQIRNIPNNGFDYSIEKYLNNRFNDDVKKYIRLNYLGDFDSVINEYFSLADSGIDIGEDNKLTSLMDINIMKINEQINISILFSRNNYEIETVQKILDCFVNKLDEIVKSCENKEDREFTPSDFDSVDISQDDLDILFM